MTSDLPDWSPISTAPKDGTPVLVGKFDWDGAWHVGVAWSRFGSWPMGQHTLFHEPTHWHPLPAPPVLS